MAFDADGLSRLLRSTPLSTQDVLFLGDEFKVPWVHALANSTKMITLKTGRNRAPEVLVQKAVDDNVSPCPVRSAANLDVSVTIA